MALAATAPRPSLRARWHWGRWLVAVVALAASTGAHVVVLERLPDLPVGRAREAGVSRETRPITLGNVERTAAADPVELAAAFRAHDPTRMIDIPAHAAAFIEALQPVIPDVGVSLPLIPRGAGEPVADAPQADARAAWEPRQDILKIEDAKIREELAVLPRRITPVVTWIDRAPDISLPEPPALDEVLRERAESSLDDAATVEPAAPGLEGAGPGGALMADIPFEPVAFASADPMLPATDTEVVSTLNEEVTAEPVEALLELDIQTFQPREEPGVTYVRLQITRKSATRMPVLGRDVLIMQDCSESMTQRKLRNCRDGIHHVLDSLTENDRVEILAFRDTSDRCYGRLTRFDSRARAKANTFVAGMEARGRTDVYESLQTLMSLPRDPLRPLIVILVTDGRPTAGMVDSSDIIAEFTRANDGAVSVFALGGGTRVNRFLLDLLSYRNRGDCRVEAKRQRIPDAMSAMAAELTRPVLVNLRYRFQGIGASSLYPDTLTHLYLDRPLTLFGRFVGEPPPTAFQVVGTSQEGEKDMVFAIDWGEGEPGPAAIRTQWAQHKVYGMIGEYIETRDEKVLDEMHITADRYGLVVPYGRDVVYR